MKILYHHRTGSADGQAVHIEELMTALSALGHEIVKVVPGGSEKQKFGDEDGLVAALKRYLPRAVYELMEFSYSLVAYRRLRKAYLEHRPDVLYERSNLFLFSGVWLKRRYKLPMLLEVNAPLFEERNRFDGIALKGFARWTEETAWREADFVLPVTDVLADHLRHAGVPEERIRVIPNGINQDRFLSDIDNRAVRQRLGLTDRLVLGFTGFVREWHGLNHVVELLAEDRGGRQLHLLVVGDGPARESLEAQARSLGVSGRVTFTGVIGRDDVAEYIAAFDVALQPAVTAYASPLKLFEYMALGRAIIAPDMRNIREVLSDGLDALLFNPDTEGGFREAIERVCGDDELRDSLGKAARAAITEKGLTWENNARKIESLVDEARIRSK
jgi:glycosyltransferase involved in cell wall biosynthesis